MDSAYNIDPTTKQPINITVKNLNYSIEIPGTKPSKLPCLRKKQEIVPPTEKVIIDDVSFHVKSGQMLAIMGSSGHGKTSLLNVLSCRNEGGTLTGDIELNGVKHTKHMIEHFSAYVRQDDRLLQYLTVKETLMFVAKLKLPSKLTQFEKESKVDEVLTELGLSHVSNTRVGGANIRGISGGERRRVSIGIQLLMDPSVLFLDEPTSGLDAFTANHLIQTLEVLTKKQRTIIMSIHQPRTDIFELFHMVLVLSRGKTVYFGEAPEMIQYFTDLGFPCPQLTNPSDFYLDLATIDVTSEEKEKRTSEVLKNLCQAQKDAQEKQEAPEPVSKELSDHTVAGAMRNHIGYPGFFTQSSVLARRHFKNSVIDYWCLLAQGIQALLVSLVVGAVFYHIAGDQHGLYDRFAFFFTLCGFYGYSISQDVITRNAVERNYLYFELQDKMYGHFAYYVAKLTAEFPFHIFFSVIFFIPAYFMADLNDDTETYFKLLGTVSLLLYCCRSLAVFASTTLPNYTFASMLSNMISGILVLVSGFFINLDSLGSGFRWLADISYYRWALSAAAHFDIKPRNFTCELVQKEFCIYTGEVALEKFAMADDEIWVAFTVISANVVVLLVAGFLALRFLPQRPYEY
ncbi:hypothetical protein LOTGIDRAFT_128491 [Lottia gigantea]|uniref:ABC transporter domain-containing protein n=2 Tax=Lottia gigantea TaxID=225164 RepID=V4BDK5_LOTGI|nr:hypothetical protein LOTGIDRAFT_128491 [Lottia gigantea]ESO86759.1 hypothetical protein LOTGIDRAFT_128491 [Lottia gigantea]